MIKHTPGPWTWWDGATGRPAKYDRMCLQNGDRRILSSYGGSGLDALGKTAEDRANAALIASAPALLELVTRFTFATNEGDDQAHDTHYADKQGVIRCKDSFLALIEDARAALAKINPA